MIFIKTLKTTLWLPFFISLLASGNVWVPRLIMLTANLKGGQELRVFTKRRLNKWYASPWFTVCSHTFYNFHVSSLLDSGETSGCFRFFFGFSWGDSPRYGLKAFNVTGAPKSLAEAQERPVYALAFWHPNFSHASGCFPWNWWRFSGIFQEIFWGNVQWHYSNVMYDPVQV